MPQWIIPSLGKINIGLKILGKRSDGYHEIRTVFQTISLSDRIAIRTPSDQTSIICPQMTLPRKEDNLIMKMILLLKKRGFQIPPLEIFLEKKIPLGSGLGGGSSNAAAILIMLNECFQLKLSYNEMLDFCSQIGSDVTFFLWGGTALGSGRGNIIQPLRSIGPYWICLAIPSQSSSTKSAYLKASKILTEKKKGINISNFIYSISKGNPDFSLAENDFERLLFEKNKVVMRSKALFQKYNAFCIMLSGSGSSVYALFPDRRSAVKAAGALTRSEQKNKMTVILAKTVSAKEYHERLFQVARK